MRISQEKLSTYLVKNLINWQKKNHPKNKTSGIHTAQQAAYSTCE